MREQKTWDIGGSKSGPGLSQDAGGNVAQPVDERRILEDFFDSLASAIAQGQRETISRADLRHELKKLRRLRHSVQRAKWRGQTVLILLTAIDQATSWVSHQLAATDPKHYSRLETERLWIMALVASILRKGDRFKVVQKALAERNDHRDAATIRKRCQRFFEHQPQELRWKFRRGVIRSHFLRFFDPRAAGKWVADHPGKLVPATFFNGQVVFAGLENDEEAMAILRRLTKHPNRRPRSLPRFARRSRAFRPQPR